MEQVYSFDIVHDTQAVFRSLMTVMANPLQTENIAVQAEGFHDGHGAVLAVAATLLDNEVSFYVEKNMELDKKIRAYTLAASATYQQADYIFLTGALNCENIRNLFADAKQGSLEDPQSSATFIICCESFTGDIPMRISGPGVDGVKEVYANEYLKTICLLRQEVQQEYPCGIDLIFVNNADEIMAMPRLCKVR